MLTVFCYHGQSGFANFQSDWIAPNSGTTFLKEVFSSIISSGGFGGSPQQYLFFKLSFFSEFYNLSIWLLSVNEPHRS